MRARDVVFVDGVRTPFGKSGPKGIYAETRADDLVVRVIRELLRRNPDLPKDRVGEVAIAATTQIGDQGLTIGRSAAILAGLPVTVPGYAIDRMCAGAMTAVTTTAGEVALGAADIAIAGGVEHMGRHPMGEQVDPNPRFLSESLVDESALFMGMTAENLHDRFPSITKERADAYALGQPAEGRRRLRGGQDPAGPGPDGDPHRRARLGLGDGGRAAAARDDAGGPARAEDPVPPARPGHRGQLERHQRRRDRLRHRRRGGRRRARPDRQDAPGRLLLRRRRARGDGHRPGARHREAARPAGAHHGRHRPHRDQRGVRGPGARVPRPLQDRRRRPAGEPVGRRDRARPPARLLRRPADDPARRASSPSTPRSATASPPCASAWAWAAPCCGSGSERWSGEQ